MMAGVSLAAPFTDVGGPSGTGDTTDDVGVAWGDYDSDGDLDLYLSKDNSPNKLYRNNGNGTFTNVTAQAGINRPARGWGVIGLDFTGDGLADILQANDEEPNQL
ncbi:MAG TPA: VCBS repeat-containing protein, partial [Candidatus Udaeobacter sp.]|nr:VCBS repeat-containing protein [Candidatus Udaeobacter sp.]